MTANASAPEQHKTLWRLRWVKVYGGGRSIWYHHAGNGFRLALIKGRQSRIDVDHILMLLRGRPYFRPPR